MGLILRGARIATRVPRTSLWTSQYRSKSRATYTVPIAQPQAEDKHHIPTLDECPSPTCQCRETPEGLDIDRESKLNGTMPAYALQVIVSTGRTDWKSRIQDDEDSALVNQLAKFTGPKGKYSDVSIYCTLVYRARRVTDSSAHSHTTMYPSSTHQSRPLLSETPNRRRSLHKRQTQYPPPNQAQIRTLSPRRCPTRRPHQPSCSPASNTSPASPPTTVQSRPLSRALSYLRLSTHNTNF